MTKVLLNEEVSISGEELRSRIINTMREQMPYLAGREISRVGYEIASALVYGVVGHGGSPVIERVSGLRLPPSPRTTYSSVDKRLLPPEKFLREQWSDYLDASLLTLGYLIDVDKSLYHALRAAAAKAGVPFRSYVASLGVLTPEMLRMPADGQIRQVRAIRDASQQRRRARHEIGPSVKA